MSVPSNEIQEIICTLTKCNNNVGLDNSVLLLPCSQVSIPANVGWFYGSSKRVVHAHCTAACGGHSCLTSVMGKDNFDIMQFAKCSFISCCNQTLSQIPTRLKKQPHRKTCASTFILKYSA